MNADTSCADPRARVRFEVATVGNDLHRTVSTLSLTPGPRESPFVTPSARANLVVVTQLMTSASSFDSGLEAAPARS